MIGDVRKLVTAQPFVPFTLHLASGLAIRVPTFEHVYVFPQGSRMVVVHDDDTYDILSLLLIRNITVDATGSRNRAE